MDNEELPPPTAPDSIRVCARGFADADEATEFANTLANVVRAISQYIDLSRLDGITVAYDYDEALAELDRGIQVTRPLSRTADNRVLGVAMAPAVLRDGVVKGHLMFHAPFVLPIRDAPNDDDDDAALAIYLIAHECAHVAGIRHFDERFPSTLMRPISTGPEEHVLQPLASTMWDEYEACRLSAPFGDGQAKRYEATLIDAIDAAADSANAAIRSYRSHADVDRVLREASGPLCDPLRFASYLIGHLHGLGKNWTSAPGALASAAESPYAQHIETLTDILGELWTSRDEWASLDVFSPLKALVRQVLADGGLHLTLTAEQQLYVDIPFTRETTPEFF